VSTFFRISQPHPSSPLPKGRRGGVQKLIALSKIIAEIYSGKTIEGFAAKMKIFLKINLV